jgi:hypothetical protein
MQSLRESDRGGDGAGVPLALAFALAALLGGAGMLLAKRGDALLLDLAHFSRQMLCL